MEVFVHFRINVCFRQASAYNLTEVPAEGWAFALGYIGV